MPALLGSVDIDWGALGEAAYVSAIVGLVALLVAAVGVSSSLRASAARERGGGAVAAYTAATGLCVLVLVAMIVVGIKVIAE